MEWAALNPALLATVSDRGKYGYHFNTKKGFLSINRRENEYQWLNMDEDEGGYPKEVAEAPKIEIGSTKSTANVPRSAQALPHKKLRPLIV